MKKIRTVYIKTNYTCNNNCVFCYSQHLADKTMSIREVRENLDYINDNLVFDKLILSGGEASIHPDFTGILNLISEKIDSKFLLVTNGRRISDKASISALNRFDKQKIEVSVSLHGPNQEVHDKISGVEGAFKETLESLEALYENGIWTSAVYVITKDNFMHLLQTVERLLKIGVREFRLRLVYPWLISQEKQIFNLLPDPVQAKEQILKAMEMITASQGVLHIDYMPYCYINRGRYKRRSLYSFEKGNDDVKIMFFDKFHQKSNMITTDCIQESQGHDFFENLKKNKYCDECKEPCSGIPDVFIKKGFNVFKDIK